MKQGERPPKGARELVIRLAGSYPRPTNRAIRRAVEDKFAVNLDDRSIRRYCEKASLPTGGRRSSISEKAPGTADVKLGPHRKELFYFGLRLRDRLHLWMPDEVVQLDADEDRVQHWSGKPGIWAGAPRDREEGNVEKEWSSGPYNARTHSLFSWFRQHLARNSCWQRLREVEEAIGSYVVACQSARQALENDLTSRLPGLTEAELQAMIRSLLRDIYYRVTGGAGLGLSYDPAPQGSRWRLHLGVASVDADSAEALQPLAEAHRILVAEGPNWSSFQALAKAERAFRGAADAYQEALSPDAGLRKLLLQSRCGLCP